MFPVTCGDAVFESVSRLCNTRKSIPDGQMSLSSPAADAVRAILFPVYFSKDDAERDCPESGITDLRLVDDVAAELLVHH